MTDLRARIAGLPFAERAELERSLLARRSARPAADGIPARQPGDPTPLSFAQQRLWFIAQLDPGDPAYNVYRIMRVRGRLDLPSLRQAVCDVVARHETLRTTFPAELGRPRQEIHPHGQPAISLCDVEGEAPDGREEAAVRLAAREVQTPFDLTSGPLVRLLVCRLGEDDHLLALTMHHIVSDEWSLRQFNREVGLCYSARRAGVPPELPPLPVQYADFALWERRRVERGELAAQRDFWAGHLAGAPDLLTLSAGGARPPVQRAEGRKLRWLLPRDLTADLDRLANALAATPFMLMLATFQAWLHRHTGQSDIVIGTPIAGRPRAELRDLIGFFANTLALRSHGAGDPTFRAFVGATKDTVLGGVANQELPFDEVVKLVNPNRGVSRAPLFRVLFTHRDDIGPALTHPDLDVSTVNLERDSAKCDLWLSLVDGPKGRSATLEYDTMLFEPADTQRMASQFEAVLRAVVADPDRRLSTLPPASSAVAVAEERPKPNAAGTPPTSSPRTAIVLARNSVEIQLVRIWRTLLGHSDVGVTDNFFQVGGHSLLAVEMMAKVKEIFGKTLPLHLLWYGEGTVEALARELCRDHDGTLWSCPIPIRPDGDRRALFCVHIAGGILSDYADLCRHLDAGQPIYGLQAVGIDGTMPPHTSVADIARHCIQSMRRIQPEGPYRILGYCSGGVFAYEMARQLTVAGQPAEFLGLIDTAAPGYRRRALFDRLGRRLRRLPRRAMTIASHAFTDEPEAGEGIRHTHLVALSKYVAEAYPGAVHLFRSALWSEGEHPTTGWRDLLSGDVSVLDVPCDHDQIVRDPAARLIADRISEALSHLPS